MRSKLADLKRQLRFTYELFAAGVLTWALISSLHDQRRPRSGREVVVSIAAYVMVVSFLLINAYKRLAKSQ